MSAVPKSDPPLLLREDRDGICTLTMNRPQQMNLLTSEMLAALQAAFDSLKNERQARVVILAAAGKGFCAGHDLKEIRDLGELSKIEQLFAQCSRMMQTITALPQPVIARVQGTATAAGCQLVAMCDLAVAGASARFAVSGINFGLFCSTPGVALARNVPRKQALEMLLTGDFIDAATALDYGLINRMVPDSDLDDAIAALAARISAKPAISIARGKRLFYAQAEQGIAAALALAEQVMADNMMDAEAQEGFRAFIEKRRPSWSL